MTHHPDLLTANTYGTGLPAPAGNHVVVIDLGIRNMMLDMPAAGIADAKQANAAAIAGLTNWDSPESLGAGNPMAAELAFWILLTIACMVVISVIEPTISFIRKRRKRRAANVA